MPDGYTLLIATVGPIVNNKFMYKDLDFDPDRAFAPIALLAYSPMIVVGSPKLPVTNLKELFAYAKDHHGPLNAGTVGVGSQAHIYDPADQQARRHFHRPRALSHHLAVAARSGVGRSAAFGPVCSDLRAAGAVGNAQGLAITSRKRLPELPDVPTADESGLPGLEANGWSALFAPAGTPRDIVDKINGARE